VFIDSVLDIFDDIVKGEETLVGLTRWKILNPKTLKDKAIYVMKKEDIWLSRWKCKSKYNPQRTY